MTGTEKIEKRECKNCHKLRSEILERKDLQMPKTDHIVENIKEDTYKGYRYECMRCGQVTFRIIKEKKEKLEVI